MQAIQISLPTLGERRFLLRALDGHSELQMEARDPACANRLLSWMLREVDGTLVDLASLLTTWRDRALAEIYRAVIGEQIECRSKCKVCEEELEFAFPLTDVIRQQDAKAAETDLRLDDDGAWSIAEGSNGKTVKLRPPTLADVATAADPKALSQSLVVAGKLSCEKVEAVLEDAAPLLSFEMEATCPECGAHQHIGFDIARFLIDSLAGERAFLIRETHLIASRYGWSHETIMALPRSDRQAYAGLIESERGAALARQA